MSTTFLDGPAESKRLNLARSPMFLRVVISPTGDVDALDLLDDEPKDNETIHVYRLAQSLGSGFFCSRGNGCRRFSSAIYALNDVQPGDEIVRDVLKWRSWCQDQVPPEPKDGC